MVKGIALTVIVMLTAVFGYQNLAGVPLKLVFGNPVNVSLTFLMGISFFTGIVSSVIIRMIIKSINNKEEY